MNVHEKNKVVMKDSTHDDAMEEMQRHGLWLRSVETGEWLDEETAPLDKLLLVHQGGEFPYTAAYKTMNHPYRSVTAISNPDYAEIRIRDDWKEPRWFEWKTHDGEIFTNQPNWWFPRQMVRCRRIYDYDPFVGGIGHHQNMVKTEIITEPAKRPVEIRPYEWSALTERNLNSLCNITWWYSADALKDIHDMRVLLPH